MWYHQIWLRFYFFGVLWVVFRIDLGNWKWKKSTICKSIYLILFRKNHLKRDLTFDWTMISVLNTFSPIVWKKLLGSNGLRKSVYIFVGFESFGRYEGFNKLVVLSLAIRFFHHHSHIFIGILKVQTFLGTSIRRFVLFHVWHLENGCWIISTAKHSRRRLKQLNNQTIEIFHIFQEKITVSRWTLLSDSHHFR